MKCRSYSHFFSKNISVYAILNNQNFNDTLTKDIVSFEQPASGFHQVGPTSYRHKDVETLGSDLMIEKTS